MSIQFVLDPKLTPAREAEVLALWADVTNAGGAVGLVGPVTAEDARPLWERHRAAIAEGTCRLLVGVDGEEPGAPVVATAFLQLNTAALVRHWLTLYRVMVHPDHQGGGAGRGLMSAAADAARSLDGMRAIRLSCRGGLGLERFYKSCGYQETGRTPDALKVAEDDLRDEITFWMPL